MAIEVVFEKRIHNTAVHRSVDVEQRREYILLTFLAALFLLGLMFYGWQQYRWIQLGREIQNLRNEKVELIEYGNQLQVDYNTQTADKRIERLARTKLGMISPTSAQIVTLTPDLMRPPFDTESSLAPLTASKR